jgi:hypothetical protein
MHIYEERAAVTQMNVSWLTFIGSTMQMDVIYKQDHNSDCVKPSSI